MHPLLSQWIRCIGTISLPFLTLLTFLTAVTSLEPEFGDKVPNITIAVGREGVLPCVVDHLGNYKVAWIKVDTQTILTIHTHVITHSPRVGASHNGHRIWNLHIRQIKEEDRGFYMCQINTSPMKNQVGYIEVVVPPDIIYKETSSDMAVTEGSTVTLVCRTTGYPPPTTTWRREDGGVIILRTSGRDKLKVTQVDSEVFNISKVTRKHMGPYLCIAANGVPPSVSKRIMLQVNFEPSIRVPNQLVGAPPGKEVLLECLVEASPRSVTYWTRENGDMIISSTKYEVLEVGVDSYQVHFKLKIRDLEEKDFGSYHCISKNLLGEAEGKIRLHEIDLATVKNRLETKDSFATDGIEDLVSTNLTLSSQKGLDSYKHSLVNQLEGSHLDNSRLSSRPSKGEDMSDPKYSEILKNPTGKKSAAGSSSSTISNWMYHQHIVFVILTVFIWIFL